MASWLRRPTLPHPPPALAHPTESRARTTAGASALGVTAILIWALITLLLFLLAGANGQLHRMAWWAGVLGGEGQLRPAATTCRPPPAPPAPLPRRAQVAHQQDLQEQGL